MPVRRDKRTGAWIFQSTIKLADGLAALPRRSLWVASEPDRLCVTYDRMIGSVHAIYDRAGVARPPKALHCLRRTFGTVTARKVPLPVLQKLMGPRTCRQRFATT